MNYDELELERKRKIVKNFWSFAYAKYCVEHEEEVAQNIKDTYNTLHKAFAGILRPEDNDPVRMQQAAEVLKAADEVHADIRNITQNREKVRHELEMIKAEDIPERARQIKQGIVDYCNKFATEQDKKLLANGGLCLLEYLDEMNSDPLLAAAVGLSTAQMTVAAKVVTMASLIQEGMKSLELELIDSANPQPSISPEEHEKNLARIACMDTVNSQRLNGDLLKELQKNHLLKKAGEDDRLELAGILADTERRRAFSVAIADDAEAMLKAPKVPSI